MKKSRDHWAFLTRRHPGKRYEDWDLDDPAGQDLDTVRRIRDELDQCVQRLIAELLPDEGASSG